MTAGPSGGPPRLSRRIRVLWLIGGIPVHRVNHEALIHRVEILKSAALIHAVWAEAGERLAARGHVPEVWGSANRGPV